MIKVLVVGLNGRTRITAASLAGKMFYVMRMLMDSTEGDIEAVLDMSAEDDEVSQALKRVYPQNGLLAVPTAALTVPGARHRFGGYEVAGHAPANGVTPITMSAIVTGVAGPGDAVSP